MKHLVRVLKNTKVSLDTGQRSGGQATRHAVIEIPIVHGHLYISFSIDICFEINKHLTRLLLE